MTTSTVRVLLPTTHPVPDRTAAVGLALCEGFEADLSLVSPIVATEIVGQPVDELRSERERKIAEEVFALSQRAEDNVHVSGGVHPGRSLRSIITDAATQHDADLVLLDADVLSDEYGLSRSEIRKIARSVTCGALVLSGPDVPKTARITILIPIADGPHSRLALSVARACAPVDDVWVEILHVISPTATESERTAAEDMLETAKEGFNSGRVDSWLLEADDVAEAIIEQAEHYTLTLIGAPERPRLKRFLFGSTTDTVVSEAEAPVIVAWGNQIDEE